MPPVSIQARCQFLANSHFCVKWIIERGCHFWANLYFCVNLKPLKANVIFGWSLFLCHLNHWTRMSLFLGWLPPPTAEQSLRRRIWRKRKEARRDEIRNQGWSQEPSVRDLLDDMVVTLGPWKWAVGGGGLVWDKESTKRILSWVYGRIDEMMIN